MREGAAAPDELRAIWSQLGRLQPVDDVKASAVGWAAARRIQPAGAGRVVVARPDGEPVGLMALTAVERRIRGVKLTRLESTGDLHWVSSYPMTAGDVTAGIRALLEQLAAEGRWDELVIGPILADSPTRDALVSVGRALGMRPLVDAREGAPRIRFDGTWDAYWAARSAGLRRDTSAGERKLAKIGPVRLVEVRGGPELDAALAAFFAIEDTGWKSEGGTSIAKDPQVRAFYTALAAEAAAAGTLRMYQIRAGDLVVAANFAIVHERGLYQLKTGYLPEHGKASPGGILHKQVIQRLWSEGELAFFDFMSGAGEHSSYKQRWATDVRPYVAIRLFRRRSVRAQALARAIRFSRSFTSLREQHVPAAASVLLALQDVLGEV